MRFSHHSFTSRLNLYSNSPPFPLAPTLLPDSTSSPKTVASLKNKGGMKKRQFMTANDTSQQFSGLFIFIFSGGENSRQTNLNKIFPNKTKFDAVGDFQTTTNRHYLYVSKFVYFSGL
jgi:hypothetical protein